MPVNVNQGMLQTYNYMTAATTNQRGQGGGRGQVPRGRSVDLHDVNAVYHQTNENTFVVAQSQAPVRLKVDAPEFKPSFG